MSRKSLPGSGQLPCISASHYICLLGWFRELAAGRCSATETLSRRESRRQRLVPPRRGGNRVTHGHPALGCYVSINNVEPHKAVCIDCEHQWTKFISQISQPEAQMSVKGTRQRNWHALYSEYLLKIYVAVHRCKTAPGAILFLRLEHSHYL